MTEKTCLCREMRKARCALYGCGHSVWTSLFRITEKKLKTLGLLILFCFEVLPKHRECLKVRLASFSKYPQLSHVRHFLLNGVRLLCIMRPILSERNTKNLSDLKFCSGFRRRTKIFPTERSCRALRRTFL